MGTNPLVYLRTVADDININHHLPYSIMVDYDKPTQCYELYKMPQNQGPFSINPNPDIILSQLLGMRYALREMGK